MGLFSKFRKKAGGVADDHGDQVKGGIDKAADVADDKTGGDHTEKIDSAADKAKDAVDDLAAEE